MNNAPMKIIIFGGGGFVGSRVVQQALNAGHRVVSINRSSPSASSKAASQNDSRFTLRVGDIFHEESWRKDLEGCDAVVSCVGAFGTDEFMQRINGDGNIHAINEAHKAGVPRFVYLSTVENNLPSFFLRGYFEGKRRAEEELFRAYPSAGSGVALRPGFMYGSREVPLPQSVAAATSVSSVSLPLWLLGKPLEAVLNNRLGAALRTSLPGMLALLAPPIDVNTVAAAIVRVAEGGERAVAFCEAPAHSRVKNVLARDDIAVVATIGSAER